MSLMPNDTFMCHSQNAYNMACFSPATSARRKRPSQNTRCNGRAFLLTNLPGLLDAPVAHFRAFTFAYCLPRPGRPMKAQFSFTLAQQKVHMNVDGNKSSVPACCSTQ